MRNTVHIFLWLLAAGLATACSDKKAPTEPFTAYPVPAAPDYRAEANWAALPHRADSADQVPPGASPDQQATAAVDVFFLHPTNFSKGKAWNGDLTDASLNQNNDTWAIRHQASIFNASGRIYAPRYRQMNLGGFYSEDTASVQQAGSIAYMDVRAAFMHYLDTWNEGRPIIIAGHSQGAYHGQRLLQEFFDGKPLQDRLVAAYVPGWPFRADKFQHIPVCSSPSQTGCVSGWCSWQEGVMPKEYDKWYTDAVVVNPITWRVDGLPSPPTDHQVFIGQKFYKPLERPLIAQAQGGILWVSKPFPFIPVKNLHVGDFNLFWFNVRENVHLRTQAYLGEKGSSPDETSSPR